MGTAILRHRTTWLQIDRFLPVSEFVADVLASAGIPREQMNVVPNSIDDPGTPRALGQGYVFAGRLSNEKGVGLLLGAWEHADLGKSTHLTIVGDGPERAAVERATKRISGVRYAGPVSADQVKTHMRQSRVVVVPSLWFEALPTVLLEAYACGRPVVATKVGALETLVPADVGWLAPASLDGLAATLRASSEDPAAPTMAKRARELYLARYTPDAGIARLVETYNNLVPAATRGVTAGASDGDS
jgi:glycosyltransferase involved in cell wall biosynthesis